MEIKESINSRATSARSSSSHSCVCGNDIEGIPYTIGSRTSILWPGHCKTCEQVRARRKERQQKRHQWRNAVRKALPAKFHKAHFRHLSPQLRQCLSEIEAPGLLLWGPTGTGKSFALSAAARHFICQGQTVARITFFELCRNIRKSYRDDNGPDESTMLAGLIKKNSLILEDVGSNLEPNQTASAFEKRVLLDLVDSRSEQGRVTMLSSNLPVENIEAAYGERIGSRLYEFTVINLAGKDRRRT